MFIRALFTLLALAVFASPLQAASLEETFAQAQSAYKAGQFEQAAPLFGQVGEMLLKAKQADKARVMFSTAGTCYLKLKNYAVAANVYESLVVMKGAVPPVDLLKYYKNLELCRKLLGENALRVQALEGMLKALPKMDNIEKTNGYAGLGDTYRAMELYRKGAISYKMAFDLLPPDAKPEQRARLLTARGLCERSLGDFAGAEKSLTTAKQQADMFNMPLTQAESLSNLGILYWERGEYPKALGSFKDALNMEEKNKLRESEGREYNNIGLVYKNMGRSGEAMKHFEKSVTIAREVNNKRGEAIALINRALLNRIGGNLNDARNDYRAAKALFESIGYQRGLAGVLMGLGRIAELEDRDLAVALQNYKDALSIYVKLELPFAQAEALDFIGGVLKHTVLPGRTTRDLVFDDEPTMPKMDKGEALKQCREAYSRALTLANAISSQELQWSALQGMGFVLAREGKLEESFAQYRKAIDIVASMRVSMESAELLGEFMAGKEDLFGEAMDVCAQLYDKTKDKKYLNMQMEFSEILRNEVQKASAALVQFNFQDAKKQALYSRLMDLGKRQAKAQAAVPVVAGVPAEKGTALQSAEQKALAAEQKQAATEQKAVAQKLSVEYRNKLDEWKKKYPGNDKIFDSSARVDIQAVQNVLKDDQIALQYISLIDSLQIIIITKNNVDCKSVPVKKQDIDRKIKEDFLVGYIQNKRKSYYKGLKVLHALYKDLIEPVTAALEQKKRIYIIADGFLAQVPFAALVSSENTPPRFLIKDYEISNIRPSFIIALTDARSKKSAKTLLAAANPRNELVVSMKYLQGALDEVDNASSIIKRTANDNDVVDIAVKHEATNTWVMDKLKKTSYEMIYFATHGVPSSEIYTQYKLEKASLQRNLAKYILKEINKNAYPEYKDKQLPEVQELVNNEISIIEKNFLGDQISPFNSYLYMAVDKNNNSDSGLLTIKMIYELNRDDGKDPFENTRYVILSACNTGVTFAPKSLVDEQTENALNNAKIVEKKLRKVGWMPGIDQVSFVDSFMQRGVNNVFGTLWAADDAASSFLLSNFINKLMKQGDSKDAVTAYTDAVRLYLKMAESSDKPIKAANYANEEQLDPVIWASGTIFGK